MSFSGMKYSYEKMKKALAVPTIDDMVFMQLKDRFDPLRPDHRLPILRTAISGNGNPPLSFPSTAVPNPVAAPSTVNTNINTQYPGAPTHATIVPMSPPALDRYIVSHMSAPVAGHGLDMDVHDGGHWWTQALQHPVVTVQKLVAVIGAHLMSTGAYVRLTAQDVVAHFANWDGTARGLLMDVRLVWRLVVVAALAAMVYESTVVLEALFQLWREIGVILRDVFEGGNSVLRAVFWVLEAMWDDLWAILDFVTRPIRRVLNNTL